jgi:hypothetical protein
MSDFYNPLLIDSLNFVKQSITQCDETHTLFFSCSECIATLFFSVCFTYQTNKQHEIKRRNCYS